MTVKTRGLAAVLFAAAAISLILPIRALFMGEGDFVFHMKQASTYSMLLEIVFLWILFTGTILFIGDIKKRSFAFGVIFLVFCWLHVTFLPMLISGLYIGFILLLGRFLRKRCLEVPEGFGIFADFLLGCGILLTEFCLFSAFKAGGIQVLKVVCALQGGILYIAFLIGLLRDRKKERAKRASKTGNRIRTGNEIKTDNGTRTEWLLFSFILLMVLIQVGKMNVTLDFDTLWYGVRSEYILDFGNGIYENPGLVGMVYVYSKGLEVLTLPLSNLDSHGYLQFFNVWVTVLGILAVYRLAGFYMRKSFALFSAALVSSLPGVMNMSIAVKPDIITWVLQIIMVVFLLCHIKSTKHREECQTGFLILAAGAYVLSLSMKPTSLVFSTALFGMAGLYLIVTRTLCLKAPLRHWLLLVPEAAALAGLWARTMLITGMPVTSVFTSILEKLGFQMKYPFATSGLPQSWQEESHIHVLLRRLYQMLLSPQGKDMGHVVIAWGSSLLFFLVVCFLVYLVAFRQKRTVREPELCFAHALFWPFLTVNLISLVMLYQVDGNYFIMLYTAVILFCCRGLSLFKKGYLKRAALGFLVPVLCLNILMCAISNWAWALGFSKIELINSGRANHKEMQHQNKINTGNTEIWKILAANPENRVIAFGEHPICLEFPCIVQSYKDVTAPWGNVELVNSPEAFESYMEYAKTDYIYVQAGYIGENSWSWSYRLLKDLIRRGSLVDLAFENGNVIARVNVANRNGNAYNEGNFSTEDNLTRFSEYYKKSE